MNILIATEFFPESGSASITGGVEARCYHLAKSLSLKHNVYILTSRRKGQASEGRIADINVIRIGPSYPYTSYGSLFRRILFSKLAYLKIPSIVRRYGIEIVDAQSYLTYPVALRRVPAKRFMTYHEVWIGDWMKNTRSIFGLIGEVSERAVLSLAKASGVRFISVSAYTKEKLVKRGIPDDRISIVGNGVDLSPYLGKPARKSGNFTLCSIGRLIPQKRVDDIIMAASLLVKDIPDLKVKVIGKGEEEERLKGLAKEMGVEKNVDFIGHLPDYSDVIKTLRGCDLFVSASTREGFGIVLIEAAASGVPYVCSDIEPFIEVTRDGRGGLIFRREDHKDLYRKVLRLAKDRALYERKREECSSLAKKYGWDSIAARLSKVYDGSVTSGRRP